MDRRRFIEFGVVTLATAAVSLLTGCSRKDNIPKLEKLGNQEPLWKMTASSEKVNEPIDLAYVKNTPAAYRDSSFGKVDPGFKPKTGGG